jgi:glutamine amidotransferase
MFGFRSKVPARVLSSLVTEASSLSAQSNEHKDGWGIAYYDREVPDAARGVDPAHRDPEFARVSAGLACRAVLAHVRLASVGAVHLRNTHPFIHQRWAFAHNGTIRRFADHQAEVEATIDAAYRPLLQGQTDSERCFYVFLSHLGRLASGGDPPTAEQVAIALARTTRQIEDIADRPDLEPSSMSFLVTDGRVMVAARRHRSLYVSGGARLALSPGDPVEQLTIASEKLTAGDGWHEVPEDGLVGVDQDLTFRRWSLAQLL